MKNFFERIKKLPTSVLLAVAVVVAFLTTMVVNAPTVFLGIVSVVAIWAAVYRLTVYVMFKN